MKLQLKFTVIAVVTILSCNSTLSYSEDRGNLLEESTSSLPVEFIGHWSGQCTNTSPDNAVVTFGSEISISPVSDQKFVWKTVYSQPGQQPQIRNYHLILDGNRKGHFHINENNGLLIDGFISAKSMYQLFSLTTGPVISATYRVDGDTMIVDMPTWTSLDPRITTTTDGRNTVHSYKVTGIQNCTLRRLP